MRNTLLASIARPPSPAPDTAPHAGIGHTQPPDDVLLSAKEAAVFLHLSIAAFWRNVTNRRLPEPVYPAPRAPRWWRSRLLATVNATQSSPHDNMLTRRAAKLARQRAEAKQMRRKCKSDPATDATPAA